MSIHPSRSLIPSALVLLASLALAACGGERKSIEDQIAPAAKKPSELKKEAKSTMTPEELAEARRKAGFRSNEEIMAETMKEFEKGDREWIKTRLAEYRKLVDDMRATLDDMEKEAPKWAAAKDPQKAFDKWHGKFKDKVKAIIKEYDRLTEKGSKGGNTQAIFGKAFRTWEDLKNDISPDVAGNERFPEVLKSIREDLDKMSAAFDEIEKDETLVVNKFYKPGQSGDPKGEGEEGGE